MRRRPILTYRPDLERLEAKQLLSGSPPAVQSLNLTDGPGGLSLQPVDAAGHIMTTGIRPMHRALPGHQRGSVSDPPISDQAVNTQTGFLVYRITQPNRFNNKLVPPFGHVNVQVRPPVPGQMYNILEVAVRNGTAQTFDASSNFQVQITGGHRVPILTGNDQWKPGQDFIFYILTKKYYPLPQQVTSGFIFFLDGGYSVAIPGPSGIFLRIKYDPATINKILDFAATRGPGAMGGAGIKFGMPDTAIYEFVSAKTQKQDFGGLF